MTRLAVWSPLPPARSGIADYVLETLPGLTERFEVEAVVDRPELVQLPDGLARRVRVCRPADSRADLDLYHVGNSPEHAYVYRAALARPGIVVLHEWNLHHLILLETVERGDVTAYLREMRREHGQIGSFVARQVSRALGGEMLPALYPLNLRLLDTCLAVVALTRTIADRARRVLGERPVLQLPHHLALPLQPLPSRAEARRALGLPLDAEIITAPGLATRAKGLDSVVRAVADLARAHPRLLLVVAGPEDPRLPLEAWVRAAGLGARVVRTGRLAMDDFVRHLVAADVVAALRFPSYGEVSGALVRALGVGRPVLVTAGTPPAEELPAGLVVPVDPGVREVTALTALLRLLLEDVHLREALGRAAREYVVTRHDLGLTIDALAGFVADVLRARDALARRVPVDTLRKEGLVAFLLDEVRWYARSVDVPLDVVRPHAAALLGEPS